MIEGIAFKLVITLVVGIYVGMVMSNIDID